MKKSTLAIFSGLLVITLCYGFMYLSSMSSRHNVVDTAYDASLESDAGLTSDSNYLDEVSEDVGLNYNDTSTYSDSVIICEEPVCQ